jgi:TPR repeat protein
MEAREHHQRGLDEAAAGRAAEAVAAWQQAAAMGSPEAMCALGVAYHDGSGVPRDDYAALLHFRAAARLGNGEAACFAGMLLETARPPNGNEALLWYRRAEAAGNPLAAEKRHRLVERVLKRLSQAAG